MEKAAQRSMQNSVSSKNIHPLRRISISIDGKEDCLREIKEDEVIKILEVDPKRRSKIQIANLTNYLWKIPFFEEYIKWGKYQIVEQWSKQFLIRAYKRNKTIIKWGEVGQEFYIILKGWVSVYLRKTIEPSMTYVEFCVFIKKHLAFINSVDDKPLDEQFVRFIDILKFNGSFDEEDAEDLR